MIESRVRFRHLQTFLEVARQKSVVKAAGLLNVSQPAVTKTIRELEEALGVAVFERDGRGIRITRSGEIFMRHAGMAITALRQGIDSVANAGTRRRRADPRRRPADGLGAHHALCDEPVPQGGDRQHDQDHHGREFGAAGAIAAGRARPRGRAAGGTGEDDRLLLRAPLFRAGAVRGARRPSAARQGRGRVPAARAISRC